MTLRTTSIFLFTSLFLVLGSNRVFSQIEDKIHCAEAQTMYSVEEALASPSTAIKLDIAMQKLTTVDPAIAKLENLRCLDLSFNRISDLPAEMKSMEALEYINLSGTRFLAKLPEVLKELESLETLDLRDHPEWSQETKKAAVAALPDVNVLID